MNNIYEKLDDGTMKITRPRDEFVTMNSLLQKKARLEDELDFVNEAIAQAEALGLSDPE